MLDNTTILIIGPVLGFMTFLYNVTSMEGILYRPNIQGKKEFTLTVLKDYLVAPFQIGSSKFDTIWANYSGLTFMECIDLLKLNWVFMVSAGLCTSALIILFKGIF